MELAEYTRKKKSYREWEETASWRLLPAVNSASWTYMHMFLERCLPRRA